MLHGSEPVVGLRWPAKVRQLFGFTSLLYPFLCIYISAQQHRLCVAIDYNCSNELESCAVAATLMAAPVNRLNDRPRPFKVTGSAFDDLEPLLHVRIKAVSLTCICHAFAAEHLVSTR